MYQGGEIALQADCEGFDSPTFHSLLFCIMEEEMVTISKKKYESLLEDSRVLDALHAGGVDNWEWYSESIQEHYPEYFDD